MSEHLLARWLSFAGAHSHTHTHTYTSTLRICRASTTVLQPFGVRRSVPIHPARVADCAHCVRTNKHSNTTPRTDSRTHRIVPSFLPSFVPAFVPAFVRSFVRLCAFVLSSARTPALSLKYCCARARPPRLPRRAADVVVGWWFVVNTPGTTTDNGRELVQERSWKVGFFPQAKAVSQSPKGVVVRSSTKWGRKGPTCRGLAVDNERRGSPNTQITWAVEFIARMLPLMRESSVGRGLRRQGHAQQSLG